jgi:hypothetical protein
MSSPLRTAEDYELFVYTIKEAFPSVRHSTLTFVRRGASLARVAGELHFDHGFRLIVRERLVYDHLPVRIDWYGYEIRRGEEIFSWYDSQPHPDDVSLRSTDPHHKHVPPHIKHNRKPAPQMSFSRPNLPELIREIEELITKRQRATD